MKHLPIPFAETATITILRNKEKIVTLSVEKATSTIEQFQALLYRDAITTGMLFDFESETKLSFVNSSFKFDVDAIQINKNGTISHLGILKKSKNDAPFINAYYTKYLLMLPKGSIKKYGLITENESKSSNRLFPLFSISISNSIRK